MTVSRRQHHKVECNYCGGKRSSEHMTRGMGHDNEWYCDHGCIRQNAKDCDHSGVDQDEDAHGLRTATCEWCGFDLRAYAIDEEYLKDSGEIMVLEWRAML